MTSLVSVAPPVARDRWGQPLIVPPGGGKPIPYTRCTSFVDCLESKYNLSLWEMRMVATGLSMRPDLQLAVAAHKDDKEKLDAICKEASEAAAAHGKATIGTALHAFTEQLDRGRQEVDVPDAYKADLAAYQVATVDLKAIHIEQLCVLDPLKVAGTPDRVVKYQGKRYIADLKTGSIEWGAGKIAMQLAVYARSQTYDHVTNTRGMHGADLERAIIIHLPAGTGTCDLYWVDIAAGWQGVALAKHVRGWRARRFTALCQPLGGLDEADAKAEAREEADATRPDFETLIRRANSLPALTALWIDHQDTWTDADTAVAAEVKAGILKDIAIAANNARSTAEDLWGAASPL